MIRLMALVPVCAAEGFVGTPVSGDGWTEFPTLTDAQRTTLRDRHGLWLRVHPHDYEALNELGLDFARDAEGHPSYQSPLVELGADEETEGNRSSNAPESSRAAQGKEPIVTDPGQGIGKDGGAESDAKDTKTVTTTTTPNTKTTAPDPDAGKSKRKDR